MRTLTISLSIAVLLLAGCRTSRPAPAPAPQATPQPARPAASGPQRLRYYDMRDFPLKNRILIVRANQAQLRAIDEHLSEMRAILKDAKAHEATAPKAPKRTGPDLVVQIHAVHDLVRAQPDLDVLGAIRSGLGEEHAKDTVLRLQGKFAVVVKATPANQDRIAEILDKLRGSKNP